MGCCLTARDKKQSRFDKGMSELGIEILLGSEAGMSQSKSLIGGKAGRFRMPQALRNT